MKKILVSSVPGICLLILTTTLTNAQLASNHVKPTGRFVVFNKSDSENFAGAGRVSPSVIRSFIKTYKDVSGERWIEVNEGFVAMFNYSGADYQVAYDKRGNLLRTIRSFNEDQMPPDLRHIVKSNYYDYDITRVHQIETPLDPVSYIVQLAGKNELIKLGICEGEMGELQKFNKSK